MSSQDLLKKYPIVNDYIKKLRVIKSTKSYDTKSRLRHESTQLLGVMTAKAAKIATEQAELLGL